MTSIFKDWSNREGWENCTTRVLRDILENPEHEKFKEVADRLEVLEDDGKTLKSYYEESIDAYEPMMNYAHILETSPSDEAILNVALNTNCCVMYHEEEDKHYIALTGGGMDLSQDIGLAYVLLEKWIPEDFIGQICNQKGLSISKENFEILRKAIIEQTKNYKARFKDIGQRWKEAKQ